MSVLSLPKTGHTQIYVSGDVRIDETAAIAPGVILQATANGQIIIKAGACIGMGTVLTANQGTIEIGEGAILGAGVLIVGSGKISDRACIGTASTLIETSVDAMEVIAPGTLLGDSSRQETLSPPPASKNHTEPESNGSHPSPQPDISPPAATSAAAENNGSQVNGHTPNPKQSDGETAEDNHQTPPDSDSSSQQQPPSSTTIYGQTHIERLMVTLFPHKEKTKKEDE